MTVGFPTAPSLLWYPLPTCSAYPPSAPNPPPALYPLPWKASSLYAGLSPETACPCPHIQCSDQLDFSLRPRPVCLILCPKGRATTGMRCMPRVPRLVMAAGCWRWTWLHGEQSGLGQGLSSNIETPSQREVGPRGRRGQDDSHLPRPHRLPPPISVNTGTLFGASTEGSVALRLKNKN